MAEVHQTQVFSEGLHGLRDRRARARIALRIDRLANGNAGDAKPVGEGVSEMRIAFGPGYWVYFVRRAAAVYLLLCGGDKSSQERDIRAAKRLAKEGTS
jgi:putative addiction module killer protein